MILFLALFQMANALAAPIFLSDIRQTHYQLQDYGEDFVEKHSKDTGTLFVIDYSRDGSEARKFSTAEIRALQNAGQNRVVAYLSIGETEEARWYWPTLPKKLKGKSNPNFPDNFAAPYWEADWQKIIAFGKKSYLERIQEADFDGVYLDLVDAYELYPRRKSAAAEMQRFVEGIAHQARKKNPDFLVIQQNASCLPEANNNPGYFSAVSGIAVESTFFYGTKTEDNELAPQGEVLRCLKKFTAAGKPIFGVEYVNEAAKQELAKKLFKENGMIGLATDRLLKGKFFSR